MYQSYKWKKHMFSTAKLSTTELAKIQPCQQNISQPLLHKEKGTSS